MTEPLSESPMSSVMPFLEFAPSPAASEDADDMKGPRRSGRARRPPRPKEAEEYVTHVRHPSLTGAALSTPPSSPAPHGQDSEANPVAAPARKRAGSVKVEKSPQDTVADMAQAQSNEPAAPATASNRKGFQDVDLASIPGVVTTQRVRRPPQNLAEFVSSEDFKASPCGKRQERALQSLNDTLAESNPRDKKEGRRSRSEGQLAYSASGKSATATEMDKEVTEARPQQGSPERSTSVQGLEVALRLSQTEARPATIPLSALSHSKRDNQDFSCLNSKKQRRDAGNINDRSRSAYSKRHDNNRQFLSRQEILERRRRNGKREIMVASEDDWSDSDFDFLRDEQENYRLMRIRARRTQSARGWWSRCGKDEEEVEDGYVDVTSEDDKEIERENLCRAEGEKMKLLMDPSVINYGFDSCDGEYILDYHQGPLFNNVTWPEFSDVKEDSSSTKNINNNNNNINNSNSTDGNTEEAELCSVSDSEIAAVVAAANSGVVAEAHVHMEGVAAVQVVNAGAKENKEEIEAEDFIGWSLCE
ncbi:hypothetical protein BGZ58_006015 [Dissophora ornata]|nr:hypothetical protein BGZ58_006015 [Dissophora ornata]